MRRKYMVPFLVGIAVLLMGRTITDTAMAAPNVGKMTKEELKAKLGEPQVVLVDVRSDHDWKVSDVKIQRAIRVDPGNILSITDKYPKDTTLVLYCA